MVLISEITEEGEEGEGPTKSPAQTNEPPVAGLAAAVGPAGGDAGPAAPNEYAMRVAYIMRSYFYLRAQQVASGQPPPHPAVAAAERCKAMMEVVRKEAGRWVVSKLTTEHNHPVGPPSGEGPAPSLGMAFETVEAAKLFYYDYAERNGFKPRTGSNRRSAGSGALIMQRFLCWRGNYLMYRKPTADAEARKRKRGPYKKRARRLEDEPRPPPSPANPATLAVIDLETSPENGGATADDSHPTVAAAPILNLRPATKAPLAAVTPESRLLRELGIRVSKYTNEERRDIIMKYMMKKSSRQAAERPLKVMPVKVASRQALAERRRRGIGGKFLSRVEMQTSNTHDEKIETETDDSVEDVLNLGEEPKIGMVFANEDRAYEFYIKYAGNVGFSVRKGWWDKSARNITRSRVYVCSREGFRPKDAVNETKESRPETRTGCLAHMSVKITSNGKYQVIEFVADHNHELAAPLDIQLLRSQRLLTKTQSGSPQKASLILSNYKNYLRSKRTKDMQIGDGGAILEYLQKMKCENPSFFYAVQVDEDDQLTNIFWSDSISQMDYYYFGDVVCFDTTYKVNEYGRPFAQFLGINHHRQTIFFGAALLYDETVDSFKWLLETFMVAMCGKQPKTILTDQCLAIGEAAAAVWPGTNNRLCLWHIYQNATKQLRDIFQGSETFSHDLRRCLYDLEEEEEFLSAWQLMLEKYNLKDHEWLMKLYEDREKWALVYGRHIFSADMKRTLQSENFSTILKENLRQEVDLLHFFKQYNTLLDERRFAEQEADYQARQNIHRLSLQWQSVNAYTPAVFDMFRMEFELFMNSTVYSNAEFGTVSEYRVAVKGKTNEQIVRFNSSDGMLTCTCSMFELVGIQCCHVLKVLDFQNINELPQQYILKRWKTDAKARSVRETHGFALDGDPKSSLPRQYSSLCRILYMIAARASENLEAYAFLESQSDQLLEQVERILQTRLIEEPSSNEVFKEQLHNPNHSEGENPDSNSDLQRDSGKKDRGVRRKHQCGPQTNKRQKGRKGQSGEAEAAVGGNEQPVSSSGILTHPSNLSNQFFGPGHFIQGSYIPAPQFGHGPLEGFHGMTQFSQETPATTLPRGPQPFHGSALLSQNVQASAAADMHSLQFVGSTNPQLDQQSSEQGHYTIPVWDFL